MRDYEQLSFEATLLEKDLFASRMDSLYPSSPNLNRGLPVRRMTSVFYQALRTLERDEIIMYTKCPAGFIIPYARLILLNYASLMDESFFGTPKHSGEISELERLYIKQARRVDELKLNLYNLRDRTSKINSPSLIRLFEDFDRVVEIMGLQVSRFAQKMSFRASVTSIKESRLGIEHNERVKRLTQLAFVFIPLSFVTSLFGMNIAALGTGSAKIWMFLLAMVLTYVSVGILWIILHYYQDVAGLLKRKYRNKPRW